MNTNLGDSSCTGMNRRNFCARTILAAGVGGLLAGCSQSATAPQFTTQAITPLPRVSPLVHANRTVTFLFENPRSHSVQVLLNDQKPVAMTNNGRGLWTVTIGPMAPGIYNYALKVDGTWMLDPWNAWCRSSLFYAGSLFMVPGNPPKLWEDCNVPHGVVARHFYHSNIVGDNRDYFVYTPPGYDSTVGRRYPVLYLLHGYSDLAAGWIKNGRANFILDNLIAQGKAKPMIVVMPLGYGDNRIVDRRIPHAYTRYWMDNAVAFRETLLQEIMPRIEQQYNVKTDRDHTAIAGLSMGGGESLFVGLNDLNRFAWIGGFSASLGRPDAAIFPRRFPKLSSHDNNRIRLLWLACGRQDPVVGKEIRLLYPWLKAKGIHFTQVWTRGVHSWHVWRGNLAVFAPLLFR